VQQYLLLFLGYLYENIRCIDENVMNTCNMMVLECKNPLGFSKKTPSSNFIGAVIKSYVAAKRTYFDFEVCTNYESIIALDQSFKAAKCLKNNGITGGAYKGLLTVTNGSGCVVSQSWTQSSGHEHQTFSLQELKINSESMGYPPVKIVYTDNCCADRTFLEGIFADLKKNNTSDTVFSVPQKNIIYAPLVGSSTILTPLLDYIEETLGDSDILHLGFDIETTNTKVKKQKKNGNYFKWIQVVNTIQISTLLPHAMVHVFKVDSQHTLDSHKAVMGTMLAILSHRKVKLVGRCVSSFDITNMNAYFGTDIPLTQGIDLAHIAFEKGWITSKIVSLQSLARIVTGYLLKKEERQSNWGGDLSKDQIQYAACDAMISLLIHEKITKHEGDPDISTVKPLAFQTVLLDSFHLEARITGECSKDHPMMWIFCLSLTEAIHLWVPEDVAIFKQYLEKFRKGVSFEDMFHENPDFVLQHCRRTIPPPEELVINMQTVLTEFKDDKYKDSVGIAQPHNIMYNHTSYFPCF
jgi:hypothetical protein